MRPEIKAAIVVGAVIFAGGIIWAINSGRSAKQTDIPMDVSPADLKKKDVALAGDKRGTVPELKKPNGLAAPGGSRTTGAGGAKPANEPRIEPRPAPTSATPPHDGSRRPAEVVIPGGASLNASESRLPVTQPGARLEPGTRPSEPATPAGPSREGPGETVLTPGRGGSDRPVSTPPKPESAAATPRNDPPLPRTETPVKRDTATTAPPGGAAPLGKLDKPGEAGTTHTIAAGDTLAAIARQKLGRESRWTEIAALNPGIDPLHLREGQKIKLPPTTGAGGGTTGPVAGTRKPGERPAAGGGGASARPTDGTAGAKPAGDASGAGTYKVERGETLVAIAKKALGDAGRWTEIYELNRDLLSSPDKVRAGMSLKLPARKKP